MKMNSSIRMHITFLLLVTFAISNAVGTHVFAQSVGDRIDQLVEQYNAHQNAGRFVQAEKQARELNALAKRGRNGGVIVAISTYYIGMSLRGQQRYADAAKEFERALPLYDQHVAQLKYSPLRELATTYVNLGRYADAEKQYRAAITHREKLHGKNDFKLWKALYEYSGLLTTLGRFDESQTMLRRCRSIITSHKDVSKAYPLALVTSGEARLCGTKCDHVNAARLYQESADAERKIYGGDHVQVARSMQGAGINYVHLKDFAQGDKFLKQALEMMRRVRAADTDVAWVRRHLGFSYHQQGRYAEAERLYQLSLRAHERVLGPHHPTVAGTLMNLGVMLRQQRRAKESLPILQRSFEIQQRSLGKGHTSVLKLMANIGEVYSELKRYDSAEQIFLQGLEIAGEDSYLGAALFLWGLGGVYTEQGRYDKAEKTLKQTIETKQRIGNIQNVHGFLATDYDVLASLYKKMGRLDDALVNYNRSIKLYGESAVSAGSNAFSYANRADVLWRQKNYETARSDLRKAMRFAEQQRADFSGGEVERSGAFAQGYSVIFEQMVRLQTKAGDMNEALDAMERGRARALVDQLSIQGLDLLQGVPEDEASELRGQLNGAMNQIAQIEQQLIQLSSSNADASEVEKRRKHLTTESQRAQQEYVSVQAQIRNASPAYRLAVARDQKPVQLDELAAYATQKKAIVLRYLIGLDGSYLLVVPNDGAPQLVSLDVDKNVSKALGVEPGPLNEARLIQALIGSDQGVMQLLRTADSAAAMKSLTPKLAALSKLLIPDSLRQEIATKELDSLVVIPDGHLSTLPFEALVVQDGDDPEYLLDVGPPIFYAPSATVLYNLANRRESTDKTGRKPVLTVGNPTYTKQKNADELSAGARYSRLGGQLQQLPYSGLEAQWISQVFEKQGVDVGKLSKEAATETNVAFNIPGRRFVHLACHGLTDLSHGNLFGSLALTPGRRPSPSNDGFLTLSEIYELDMRGCELTILSACDTNYGPSQGGEGIWSLSRGFLVAGSRRVVASNWYVDDRAAASLISYYCSGIAKAEGNGEAADYAEKLHKAKKWVRDQEQWSSPYYWATFVLVGPN